MRKCPKCSALFDDTWRVCLYCNQQLDEVQVNPNDINKVKDVAYKKWQKDVFTLYGAGIVLLIVGIIMLIGYGFVYLISMSKQGYWRAFFSEGPSGEPLILDFFIILIVMILGIFLIMKKDKRDNETKKGDGSI